MLFQVSLKSVTCRVGALLRLIIFSHIFLCFGGHGTPRKNLLLNAAVASQQAIKKTERGSYDCPVDAFFFIST